MFAASGPTDAFAQASAASSGDKRAPAAQEQQEPETRTTGLPAHVKWTFNFDAGWGTFGFANSLYIDPKDPGTNQNLSDQWLEGYVKPALTGVFTTASGAQFYGEIGAVGERTYGSVPPAFGEDVSSFGPEDLYIGWRSGTALPMGDNALEFEVGRAPFQLGHGMLVYDGASEGGSRGGYWTNARKAFEFAAIARFQPTHHKVETFYLDRDELPEHDSGSRLWGANYELSLGSTTVGASYMRWFADVEKNPARDGLGVFNVRAYAAPIPAAPDVTVEFEYASERNGDLIASNAWTAQAAYQFSKVAWKPQFSYRYALFEGDDPATSRNEGWDPLFPGFYDWGTWWQGEIAGEYFLSNSNLGSHLVRAHVTPSEKVSGGLLLFKFMLDHPTGFGPQVTSTDAAFEVDAYSDWKVTSHFTVSLVGAFNNPGLALQQFTGRTKNFGYGMLYVAYSF